jgi:hypothetical protein
MLPWRFLHDTVSTSCMASWARLAMSSRDTTSPRQHHRRRVLTVDGPALVPLRWGLIPS